MQREEQIWLVLVGFVSFRMWMHCLMRTGWVLDVFRMFEVLNETQIGPDGAPLLDFPNAFRFFGLLGRKKEHVSISPTRRLAGVKAEISLRLNIKANQRKTKEGLRKRPRNH